MGVHSFDKLGAKMGVHSFFWQRVRAVRHTKNMGAINGLIKGGCQSGRKVVTHNSKSDLPLVFLKILRYFLGLS